MARRTEITIETSRRLVVRPLHGPLRAWCENCFADVQMITPNEVAMLMQVSSRTIYQWIERGRVHFTDEPEGLLVCRESLRQDSLKSALNHSRRD